jgi:23S rRNA (uracil1939-C5)-methyltransferase
VIEVIDPSADRVSAPCPHFGACGGCALQHWAANPYLDWKRGRIGDALARENIEAEISLLFAAGPGSRRRIALHGRRQGRDVVLGFKARRSWTVVGLETCVIADPRLVAALPALGSLTTPLLEHPKSAPILHVTVTDTGLDVDVTGVERKGGGLSADARARAAGAAARGGFVRVTLDGEPIFQDRAAQVSLGPATVKLPPGSFLQAVPAAERAMAEVMAQAAAGARGIADLYCGVGTFTFRLAAIAPVMAADASAPAIHALRGAIGGARGLRDLDRRPILVSELARTDVVVFDPPRAGAAAQCAELARSRVPCVIAVSCNPATFARDARILIDSGLHLNHVHLVDQFLWSSHIELVGVFSRSNR